MNYIQFERKQTNFNDLTKHLTWPGIYRSDEKISINHVHSQWKKTQNFLSRIPNLYNLKEPIWSDPNPIDLTKKQNKTKISLNNIQLH